MEDIHSFILLGITGDGKSSLANFLTQTNEFKIYHGKGSGTTKVQEKKFTFENNNFKVIDTPGFFDSKEEKIKINDEAIIKAINESKDPISSILMVVNFQKSRIDNQYQICVQKISELFPMEEFWRHIIIIFTKYYAEDPEELPELKKNWEKDINLFRNEIKDPRINNKIAIKLFYVNNSEKNMKSGKNNNIRKDILNYIKNVNVFYVTQMKSLIPKERINMKYENNNEPDEKYGNGNVEIRYFRSYSQIFYQLPNKNKIKGPILDEKKFTERIEFFEKLEGIKR